MLVVINVVNEMLRPGPGSRESSIRVWGQGCCRAVAGHRAKVVFLPNFAQCGVHRTTATLTPATAYI